LATSRRGHGQHYSRDDAGRGQAEDRCWHATEASGELLGARSRRDAARRVRIFAGGENLLEDAVLPGRVDHVLSPAKNGRASGDKTIEFGSGGHVSVPPWLA
jgi:hypothetical protein